MKKNQIPLIHLVGDPQENLYRLGLHDRKTYRPLMDHIITLLQSPWPPINAAIKNIAHTFLPKLVRGKGEWERSLTAYAEGLGIDYRELLYPFIIPEVLPCTARWIPRLASLGCSSYFVWDPTRNAPIHGRILDFPLVGSFDQGERAILYDFPGTPKIFSFGTSGFPYPSITAMTDEGVTFGLHQKITDIFNTAGTPVFEIAFNLLKNCGDSKSSIEFLKKSCSITTWAFYMSFKNGDVLTADLMGDQLYYHLHRIEPSSKGICRCNFLEDPEKRQKQTFPLGYNEFNRMRESLGYKKIHALKNATAEELIQTMGTPLNCRRRKANNYQCDPMTMVNVQSVVMSPTTDEALFLPDDAPKFYRGDILRFDNVFQSPEQKLATSKRFKKSVQESYRRGIQSLALAEKAYHAGDKPKVYHHLQMGIKQLEGYPEGVVGQFFFLVFQYINEKNREILLQLLGEFKNIEKELPPYMADQCRLFIARLEKRLRRSCSVTAQSMKHAALRDIFQTESQWNPIILKYLTTKLIYLNLSGFDIVYIWLKNRPSPPSHPSLTPD